MSTHCTISTPSTVDAERSLSEVPSALLGTPVSFSAATEPAGPAGDTLAVLEWLQEPAARFEGGDLNLRRYVHTSPHGC